MKKTILCVLCLLFCIKGWTQEVDSVKVASISLTDIYKLLDEVKWSVNKSPNNFKLYPTKNIWTFLKLDTRTGQIWQVQFSVQGSSYRFCETLNSEDLTWNNRNPGRFELHQTDNIYNFLLLDQETGRVWQVQWGKSSERQMIRIY